MNKGMKTVVGVAVVALAFSAASAFAVGYGPGGCGMRGGAGFSGANVNEADYQKFINETAPLRKSIAVDRAELDALMAGKDPDAKRVRELTSSIVDNQEKVAEIARASNINGPGAGFGCGGPAACGGGGGCRGGKGSGYGPGNGPGNTPCH